LLTKADGARIHELSQAHTVPCQEKCNDKFEDKILKQKGKLAHYVRTNQKRHEEEYRESIAKLSSRFAVCLDECEEAEAAALTKAAAERAASEKAAAAAAKRAAATAAEASKAAADAAAAAAEAAADAAASAAKAAEWQGTTYPVTGRITDATNMNALLGAEVVFTQGDFELRLNSSLSATSFSTSSYYHASAVPAGVVTMSVTKEGYINSVRNITINGPLNCEITSVTSRRRQTYRSRTLVYWYAGVDHGKYSKKIQAGHVCKATGPYDVSLSPVMPADDWRVVLSWNVKYESYLGRHLDLDSWIYFGDETVSPGSYSKKTSSALFGGVRVSLAYFSSSAGTETTTFSNLNNCQGKSSCNIVFKVYSTYSADPAALGAVVTLYNGATEVDSYQAGSSGYTSGHDVDPPWPDDLPATRFQSSKDWWVFKLDGLTGQATTCTSADCA